MFCLVGWFVDMKVKVGSGENPEGSLFWLVEMSPGILRFGGVPFKTRELSVEQPL